MALSTATASTPRKPRVIPAARPTREERYRAQRAQAARVVAAGLWLAVPAIVALAVGLAVPLLAGIVRAELRGAGLILLLAAGALVLHTVLSKTHKSLSALLTVLVKGRYSPSSSARARRAAPHFACPRSTRRGKLLLLLSRQEVTMGGLAPAPRLSG